MKNVRISAICALLCGSIMFSSCIGSFGLFNKTRTWNEGISSNKFINELLFIGMWIIPVYEVCLLADVLVINSVEFWTGENPMANVGDVKKVKGEDGEYLVKTNADGYTITNEEGLELELKFNEDEQSWNVVTGDQTFELMTMNGDGSVNLNLQNGDYMRVTLDDQGMMAARQLVNTSLGFAMK